MNEQMESRIVVQGLLSGKMQSWQRFDLSAAIPTAWRIQWASAEERLKKDGGKEDRFTRHYVTASDVENQVRQFADEQACGEPWGTRQAAWGHCYTRKAIQIRVGAGTTLLNECRDWLLDQVRAGMLTAHNFGRGHISGMRFRAASAGQMSHTEAKTVKDKLARRNRERPVHAVPEGAPEFSRRLLCVETARAGKPFYGSRRRSRQPRVTRNHAEVTCSRCLNILARAKQS